MTPKQPLVTLMLTVAILIFAGTVHADLTNGLVAYYPFNGNANDESGNGNYGTIYGATLETDRFGKQKSAYKFNGVDNYIFSNGYNFVGNQMSINTWIKTSNNGSDLSGKTIVELSNAVIYMSRNNYVGKIMAAFDGSTIGQTDHGTVLVNDNKWHLITCINDGNTTSIYIDTKLDAQYSDRGIGGNVTQLTIGAISAQRAFWDGSINDIRIYNRVLSSSEINEIYQEGSNQYIGITSVPDINGDGVMDQTVLAMKSGNYYLLTIDSTTGKQLKQVTLGAITDITPSALTTVGNQISVLITKSIGVSILQLRDSSTLALVKTLMLPK